MYVSKIRRDQFEDVVLGNRNLVMVDFFAPWCGPCKALAPVVECVALAFEPLLGVFQVNIDEEPGLAELYGATAVPTLVFFEKGKEVWRRTGTISKELLTHHVWELLGVDD